MRQSSLIQRRMLETIRLKANPKTNGIRPQDIRPHTLKIYAKLSPTSDSIIFKIGEADTIQKGGERLLGRGDVFFGNLFGLLLHSVKVSAGKEYAPNTPLISYPDPRVFVGPAPAGAVATESEALEAIFNGNLSMKTDQDVRLDGFPCNPFRQVSNTQQGSATIPDMDGLNLVDLSTSIIAFGDRNNEFTIKLPPGADYAGISGVLTGSGATLAGRQNYVVLAVGGFIVVNAANNARVVDLWSDLYSKIPN